MAARDFLGRPRWQDRAYDDGDRMPPLNPLPGLASGPPFFVVLALIVIISSIPMVNIAFPAEPIVMAAALSASNQLPLPALLVVTSGAAIIGDLVCYGLGRVFGPKLLKLRVVRRARRHVCGAHRAVRHRGGLAALIVQRWVPPTRGLVPVLLGTARHRVGLFVCYSAIACTVWTSIIVLGAYLAGPVLVVAIPSVLTIFLAIRAGRRLVSWRRQRRVGATT